MCQVVFWVLNFLACDRNNKIYAILFSGKPEPSIKWFREGKHVLDTADFEVAYRDSRVTLIIPEVFPQDSGQYTCMAENVAGSASSSAELIVKGWYRVLHLRKVRLTIV